MNINRQNEFLIYKFFQFTIWLIMLLLIIIRIFCYKITENNWIWIINYIGMGISFINMFIKECIKLKKAKNKKYKPFVGLTVVLIIIIIVLGVLIKIGQSFQYASSINDIITLLALFFSLSGEIWCVLLDKIAMKLKI